MPDLKIEQYNVHLFDGTVVVVDPRQIFEDPLRRSEICSRLLRERADVVSINEAWADSYKDHIIEAVRSAYPYSFYPKKSDPLKLGSGLLLLSKYEIVNPEFEEFRELHGIDALSQKGFITAELARNGSAVAKVLITHAQAGEESGDVAARADNIAQICEALQRIISSGKTMIAAIGDLNVTAELPRGAETKEYKKIKSAFAAIGLEDAYRIRNPSLRESKGFTINGLKNKLVRIFSPDDARTQKRLDYIWLNRSASGVKVPKARIITSYLYSSPKANELMDLSDHYPLEVVVTSGSLEESRP